MRRCAPVSKPRLRRVPVAAPKPRISLSSRDRTRAPAPPEALPGTFVLRSASPLSDVRRALAAAAPEGTQLMIVESRDARLGWTGLSQHGAEALRSVWDAPLGQPAE
jgi:hypothetical protein